MSALELLYREAVCPQTLPDSGSDDEESNSGLAIGDMLLVDGTASLARLGNSFSESSTGRSLRSSLMRSSLKSSNRSSYTQPPPPPPVEVTEEVQQALDAAAQRRASVQLERAASHSATVADAAIEVVVGEQVVPR